MRLTIAIVLCGLLTAPAPAALIATEHFGSMTEVQQHVIGGFDFYARGDTQALRETRTVPFAQTEVPFDLWNNGVPHGFKVVYNPGGVAGISIDDVYTAEMPVTVDSRTNGLLVTALADGAGRAVQVSNLKITLPGFVIHPVNDTAVAPNTDYLLIETDLPLCNGFILSGTTTFNWAGPLPPPAEQWFEVTPIVLPEPASGGLLAIGALLPRFLRPRRA